MAKNSVTPRCGVLVVDKPSGCTSHDVVAWARRAFATREVGHAGTLDPMATGVLVVLVGEATKLSTWVTSEDKSYEAEVRFGQETDTLDADGTITREVDLPAPDRASIEAAARSMVGALEQTPPAVSAIKVGGVAAHERVRRGEVVELAPREVVLRDVQLLTVDGPRATLALSVSKGFYVRSFARDLAARLGTLAHLTALRRTRSGVFSVDRAMDGAQLRRAREDDAAKTEAHARLIPLAALEGLVATVRVSREAAVALLKGQRPPAPEGSIEDTQLVLVDRSELALPAQPIGLAVREGDVLVARRNLLPGVILEQREPWLDGPE